MSKFTVDQVVEALEDAGADIHERYSGRGMYGAECPGIEADRESELFAVFVELALSNEEMARELARSARTDSMGRGLICYWPHIKYPKDLDEEAA